MEALKDIVAKFENGTVTYEDCYSFPDPKIRGMLLNKFILLKTTESQ